MTVKSKLGPAPGAGGSPEYGVAMCTHGMASPRYVPVPREQRWRGRFLGRSSTESSSSEEGLETVAFDKENAGSGTAAGDSVEALAIV